MLPLLRHGAKGDARTEKPCCFNNARWIRARSGVEMKGRHQTVGSVGSNIAQVLYFESHF